MQKASINNYVTIFWQKSMNVHLRLLTTVYTAPASVQLDLARTPVTVTAATPDSSVIQVDSTTCVSVR